MNAPNHSKEVAKQWVEKAEEDFRNAEYTLTMPQNCPYSTVCFHCQQCVEKYIKAMLVLHEVEFPRIHDIGELIGLLPENMPLSLTDEEQERLSDYAVMVRYPMEVEPITESDAKSALLITKRVRAVARQLMQKIF